MPYRPSLSCVVLSSLFAAACGREGGGIGLPAPDAPGSTEIRAFPRGVFESTGPLRSTSDSVVGTKSPGARDGVMLKLPWSMCDSACLIGIVRRELDAAAARGLQVSVIIGDSFSIPAEVKSQCQTFAFTFRGEPKTTCLPWDPSYLAAKKALIHDLGAAVDAHPSLAYVYFTGAASTNGNEGHWRVDQAAYAAAGYTPDKLRAAYTEIMDAYLAAFPHTPIAFEVHAIFESAEPWQSLWQHVRETGHVGVAAWWCAERLSVSGRDTTPIWPILQDAAARTFTVCQTVSSFLDSPFDFSSPALGLDYGTAASFDADDSQRAFAETIAWAQGAASHTSAPAPARFSVIEPWSQDVVAPAFEAGLRGF